MTKKTKIPYFAIGNEELRDRPEVGTTVKCPHCGKRHKVKYGKDTKTGKISKMLGFVNCGKGSYLVSINGKLLK